MERLPVAVVGLGRIASLLEEDPLREKPCTHAGAVAANGDCVLAGGADIDGERRAAFAERWGVRVYGDAEELLRRERPAILHVATHPDSHLRYCLLAEERGVPVVVCEKPLAAGLAAARAVAAIHRRGATRIIVNHERRYAADYRIVREILASGRLGPLLSVRGVLYMGRGRRILDLLWHDGTHLADALAFLTDGKLHHRRRWGAPLAGREGTAYLAGELRTKGRGAGGAAGGSTTGGGAVPFLFEVGSGRDHLAFELEFSCERGRARIGNGLFEIWESAESPYATGFRSLRRTEENFAGPTGYFAGMVADAVACARDRSRVPRSSAEDGLEVIEYLRSVSPWKDAPWRGALRLSAALKSLRP